MGSGVWAVLDSVENRTFADSERFFDGMMMFARIGEYLKQVGHEAAGNVVIENAMLLSAHFDNVKEER